MQPQNGNYLDTLAQAQFAADKQLSALKTAQKAAQTTGADKKIKGRYVTLRYRYINNQLRAIKSGNSRKGLAALAQLNFDATACIVYGQVLARLDRVDEALSVLSTAQSRFPGDSMDGMLFKNISPTMVKNTSPLRKMSDSVIFSGADKDQVATWYPQKRHSMFTYYFLKGFSGTTDVDKNKKITVAEMDAYLKNEVSYTARWQSSRKQEPMVIGDPDKVL